MSDTNDRELLELAAKAAGYEVRPYMWHKGTQFEHAGFCLDSDNEWNPLEDDGDALRLAVQLQLYILPNSNGCDVRLPSGAQILEIHGQLGDHLIATRRAIVRAAAAIGEAHGKT